MTHKKVTLSLTTADGAGRGLCHTNSRAAHWAASSGRPRPLGTRTEQTQVPCVQGPLSKPEDHQSAALRSTDSVALGPQTAASPGGDTHRTAREHQGALRATRHCCNTSILFRKRIGLRQIGTYSAWCFSTVTSPSTGRWGQGFQTYQLSSGSGFRTSQNPGHVSISSVSVYTKVFDLPNNLNL